MEPQTGHPPPEAFGLRLFDNSTAGLGKKSFLFQILLVPVIATVFGTVLDPLVATLIVASVVALTVIVIVCTT